jgi:hypothetical protein
VVGNDDRGYGIPYAAIRIVKYNPADPDTTCTLGEESEEEFDCGNGVLAGDGDIYSVNRFGQVLQIDATHNNYTWIGEDPLYSGDNGWDDPIVGVDKCIYWPPSCANRVFKFDPETQQLPASLVGGDLGEGDFKWHGGALATDGVIYCIPYCSTQVLAIDPFKEISMILHKNFRQHPQELGCLFVNDEECDETTFYNVWRR